MCVFAFFYESFKKEHYLWNGLTRSSNAKSSRTRSHTNKSRIIRDPNRNRSATPGLPISPVSRCWRELIDYFEKSAQLSAGKTRHFLSLQKSDVRLQRGRVVNMRYLFLLNENLRKDANPNRIIITEHKPRANPHASITIGSWWSRSRKNIHVWIFLVDPPWIRSSNKRSPHPLRSESIANKMLLNLMMLHLAWHRCKQFIFITGIEKREKFITT